MHTFKDEAGREWEIKLNVSAVRRVRDTLNFDLLNIADESTIEKLIGDPVTLVDIVYVLCKEQADERKLTDEDFGRAMAGDAIDGATQALLDELVSFTPNPRQRQNLGAMLAATREMMDRSADLMEEKIKAYRPDEEAKRAIERIDLSGGSQAT